MDIRVIGTADELEVADKVIMRQFEVEKKSKEYDCNRTHNSNRKRIYYNIRVKGEKRK